MEKAFHANLSYRGKILRLDGLTTSTVGSELYQRVLELISDEEHPSSSDGASDNSARTGSTCACCAGVGMGATQLKILHKGKKIKNDPLSAPIFQNAPKKTPKILVMATSSKMAEEMASRKSDPTIRGFDREEEDDKRKKEGLKKMHWGEGMAQSKDYKFCRFEACTWQSFGHRPNEKTPHAFAAMHLLEKLAADPGIVAIMKERELVVGTLGEMDPIDDRVMMKRQQQGEGGCLLGYNTNAGARIDVRLRTDELSGFRPYPELVTTLIHELSHNWVGDHNLLFWTNYAQMRAEYLHAHATLRSTIINGKTTADLAGLNGNDFNDISGVIIRDLVAEMAQHGLHPRMIEAPILLRVKELMAKRDKGQRLGVGVEAGENGRVDTSTDGVSARKQAMAAAERRMRESTDKKR